MDALLRFERRFADSKSDVLPLDDRAIKMDPRDGFEPPLTESESAVLPLDERGMITTDWLGKLPPSDDSGRQPNSP